MAAADSPFKIILGSSSMARQRILAEMGYEFTIMANAIMSRLQHTDILQEDAHTTLLITADTVVVYKGTIREKPCSEEEAREFIKGYSGGHAAVVGSVLVTNLKTGASKGGAESAEVYFHDIPNEVIDSLIDEGIPFKVAGGLMLEHPLTLPFVDTVIGATDTVMGLSKSLTEKLIQEALFQQGSSPGDQNMG
ncbi:Maf-like protein isoform 2 [Hibiscus syriacus]|uniref:Maf-like protein isoform 2 n=1 Tax=Hibiscus syriacus TaxID=106335 RepID=A0A6A3AS34_HIBSY|nr:7-methyl-GTP pyrophosphatase-like isoform X2 [Hibiscus syriacus]KAE8707096.1 Maf-like protein isoform 2 [Hibiscus syriacus]